jgi:hypothetical protein
MSVGVMKDYKLRDLHASHTLGKTGCKINNHQRERKEKKTKEKLLVFYWESKKL